MSDVPDKVTFDYIKGNQFRVVHADGVWGGVSPRLNIFMGIWSERPVIPQHVVHVVNADRTIGDEIIDERISRDANAVREVEVGIVMDAGLAKAMIKWLQDSVASLEALAKSEKEKPK